MRRIMLLVMAGMVVLSIAGTGRAATTITTAELIDSDADVVLRTLNNGDVICFPADGTQLNILATTSPSVVGSVQFSYDGDVNYHVENDAPYCIGDNIGSNYLDWTPSLGEHFLVITPYSLPNATGTAGTPMAISFTVIDGYPQVTQLVLINSTTDLDIRTLINGGTINLALDGDMLNIRADTDPSVVGSVRFNYDGVADYATENAAPYALEGDNPIGDYLDWTPTLGNHTLIVTSYAAKSATGPSGTPVTVNFTVVNATATPSPTITPTPSRTRTLTPSPVYSRTQSPTPSATRTSTPTASPTRTHSGTPSPTFTPSRTPSPDATASPTGSPTRTHTPAFTPTQSPVVTATPTQTHTVTSTRTLVPTSTATPTTWTTDPDRVMAYPMPASGDTLWFYYHVNGPAEVVIRIYNVTGEKGDVLKVVHAAAGYQRTPWDIRQVAPGVYFYQLSIKESNRQKEYEIKKLVVIKNK